MIDAEYDCDWFFEDSNCNIVQFDTKELHRTRRLKVVKAGPFYWTRGLQRLLWKDYDHYLMLGSTGNVSLFMFCLLKKLLFPRKKIYFWTHGFYGKESKLEMFLWKRPFFKLPDVVFTYGNYAKRLMMENGFADDKIFPIYNSLAYDEQLSLRNQLQSSDIYIGHFDNNNPVIVMIGRLNNRKHLDILINAVAILKDNAENYNIVLVGNGEGRQQLESLVVSKGLQKQVWFYGACYDEKTNAELVFNADLCVVPGDIGLTAIHSMMFGTPVVTHNCLIYQGPEFETIQPGVTGNFFEHGSVRSLAETIHKWLLLHKEERETVRKTCYKEIDAKWNPYYQIELLKSII